MGVTECLEGVECAVFLYVLQDIRQMKEDEVRVRDYDFFLLLVLREELERHSLPIIEALRIVCFIY